MVWGQRKGGKGSGDSSRICENETYPLQQVSHSECAEVGAPDRTESWSQTQSCWESRRGAAGGHRRAGTGSPGGLRSDSRPLQRAEPSPRGHMGTGLSWAGREGLRQRGGSPEGASSSVCCHGRWGNDVRNTPGERGVWRSRRFPHRC